ncbi:MAG TPA: PPC domain-containing protein [Longimicrobium sp.]|nr:PPC domain-containing protein [Longimicrobium sp.]
MTPRERLHRSALAAATLLLASHPALAQQPVRLGQTISSELTTADPRVSPSDSSHYKSFLYHGRRGEAVRVTMRARNFDAFLSAGMRAGGEYRPSTMNDDGAGGTDAQLNYVFTADGDLEIHANSMAVATGPFTLAVEAGTPPGPVVNHPITVGQTVRGTLTERSPQESDATFYEQYSFTGRAGQTVRVTMRSADVDSYLTLFPGEGSGAAALAHDDDGAGGNDSRIVFTLPAAGRYVIHANTVARAAGAFELALEEGSAADVPHGGGTGGGNGGGSAARATEIRAGAAVSGSLDTSDPLAGDGSHFDDYVYHGRAGERLVISLRSSAFDTYLSVATTAGGSPSQGTSDDDGAGGTDSQVTLTLPSDGDYVIRANSLEGGATGAYTLQVQKQ